MEKTLCMFAMVLALILAEGAAAAELPSFEKFGFPITQVQVSILGSADVRERSAAPSLMLQGMPASPHQIAVLMPRPNAGAHEIAQDARAGLETPSATTEIR